jgi:hypothetical protein
MNHAGHETPFLLNRVDEEVRRNFNSRILQDRIALRMATQSEELFFEETNVLFDRCSIHRDYCKCQSYLNESQ